VSGAFFIVDNTTFTYIEPFPKTLKGIHMRVWLLVISMLIENYQCRSLVAVRAQKDEI
jgi:hypothetical protein